MSYTQRIMGLCACKNQLSFLEKKRTVLNTLKKEDVMKDQPKKQSVPDRKDLSTVGARKELAGGGQAYATGYDSRWPPKSEQNNKKK